MGRENESALNLLLHKLRAVLESPISVLLKDGSVMLMRHLATIQDHADELLDLAPRIARVVDVRGSLQFKLVVSMETDQDGEKNIPSLPSAAGGEKGNERQLQ